jgi:glyoxylase-like metal-dependent hydrolase (beta-lactamase superfamily II)
MITEIIPGFYQVKLPFPRNPLRDCNVYIIRGGDKSLMVDTGIDLPEAQSELLDAIKNLGIDLKKTEFFLTHMHVDHTGNLIVLADDNSTVYFSHPDAAILDYNSPENRVSRATLSVKNGFPPGDMTAGGPLERRSHPMRDFAEKRKYRFDFIQEGQVIKIGGFAFTCYITPGHTKGHVCLYEPYKKIFLSGDHILQDITPNISTWRPDENPLADYMSSLDKVYNLDVKLVLPSHRRTFIDLKARIDELKNHHEWRASEALSILSGNGKQTGYQVAARMTWDVSQKKWEEVPIWQRMFATGEAISHLRYLVVEGKARQDDGTEQILYSAR